MKGSKILLTGAFGFLGSSFLREWSNEEVITIGRSKNNSCVADLATEVPTLRNFSDVQVVIHAAGKAHVIPRTKAEENEFFTVNLLGTKHLLEGIDQMACRPEAFVYISTIAVYGLFRGIEVGEDEPLAGTTPYAQSKIAAEKLVSEWCNDKGVRLTILRLPLVVGKGAPGNLGAMVKWMDRGWYVGIGAGDVRKSMVLASDVARHVLRLAAVGGTYNLTDGIHPSMRQFENALASKLGKSNPIRLPGQFVRQLANLGDLVGSWFPFNSDKYTKLTSTLTFNDKRARQMAGWSPRSVVDSLDEISA